jgi:hypothetical protein
MVCKLLQSWKALSSTVVTLSGMIIDKRPLQPENALFAIFVLPFAIVTVLIALYVLGKMEDKSKRPGIVTDLRPLQPENAAHSMLVTESGIVTDVRPLQR